MAGNWKCGLPPGEYYEGMIQDFEVYFSPGGLIWHRRRDPDEAAFLRCAEGNTSSSKCPSSPTTRTALEET